MKKTYLYQVQIDNDTEVLYFGSLNEIVEYINDVYKLPLMTFDKLVNHFQSRTKKKNVILGSLKILERIEQPNKLALKKEMAKL